MSQTGSDSQIEPKSDSCANCGADLDGSYCAQCGQSVLDIRRPAWSMIRDFSDDALNWDGRFFTTMRALYTRPGDVAREFMEGKRARYTPPFRLYVIVSLVFFLAFNVSGIRFIGIIDPDQVETSGFILEFDENQSESAPSSSPSTASNVRVILFRPPWIPLAPSLLQDDLEPGQGLTTANERMLIDPKNAEDRFNVAATQSVIIMILGFAFINLILHPRAPLLGHIVYSLYAHAALMPLILVSVISGMWLGRLWAGFATIIAIACFMAINAGWWRSDRVFYRSGRVTAALRILPASVLYLLVLAGTLFAFIFMTFGPLS